MIESSICMLDHNISLLELTQDVRREIGSLSQVYCTPSCIVYMVISEAEWKHMPESIRIPVGDDLSYNEWFSKRT